MDIRVRAEHSAAQKSAALCHTKLAYSGQEWIGARLPTQCEPWLPRNRGHSGFGALSEPRPDPAESGQAILQHRLQWPKRTVCFIADARGDTDALTASLVACGGIAKLGSRDEDFELTKTGKKALFLIGGDCFGKGPGNLRLLRLMRLLMERGGRVRILAGNRDVRLLHGIYSVGLSSDSRCDHFFIRLGAKSVPLLQETWDQYLKEQGGLHGVPGMSECYRQLYPSKQWFTQFPQLASQVMDEKSIEREIKRLHQKIAEFEEACQQTGMTARMIYAAAMQWQRLFMHDKGEFAWFFKRMRLAHQDGSFLFIHAGLDDSSAEFIERHGVKDLNRDFNRQLVSDPFNFFYGPLANAMRSKYREVEMPLTAHGIDMVRQQGIGAIVQGHRNRLHGQRIFLRNGMIVFECDATLDRHSRAGEGLQEIGAVATLFTSEQRALGISSDYPRIKLFDPRQTRTL